MASRLIPINPGDLGAPVGYSNGMLAPPGGRLLFVAGQIAWDAGKRLVGDDFPTQFGCALANVLTVVREAGGGPEDVARLTVYVVDREDYLASLSTLGEVYRGLMGRHFPAMAVVEVQALLEPGARVEIEATAVLPGGG